MYNQLNLTLVWSHYLAPFVTQAQYTQTRKHSIIEGNLYSFHYNAKVNWRTDSFEAQMKLPGHLTSMK